MRSHASISVVLPTYNCAPLLARHLPKMRKWLDLVHEVIVVDSRSTDGTVALIEAGLQHPRLRIIQRDRGLYPSWNEGIAATTGDWVYISTAGDTIEREQLLHLRDVGTELQADVVVSPPKFVSENGSAHRDLGWPPTKLLQEFGKGAPFVMHPAVTQYLAFLHCPSALLGSSASNLYRGEHLRRRPFPTEYAQVGDTAWIMRHAHETRLALTPRIGSCFCIHEKEDQPTPDQCYSLYRRIFDGELARLARPIGIAKSPMDKYLASLELPDRVERLRLQKRRLWRDRQNRATSKVRWLGATVGYLWWRSKLKRQRRATMGELKAEPGWFLHLTT